MYPNDNMRAQVKWYTERNLWIWHSEDKHSYQIDNSVFIGITDTLFKQKCCEKYIWSPMSLKIITLFIKLLPYEKNLKDYYDTI